MSIFLNTVFVVVSQKCFKIDRTSYNEYKYANYNLNITQITQIEIKDQATKLNKWVFKYW